MQEAAYIEEKRRKRRIIFSEENGQQKIEKHGSEVSLTWATPNLPPLPFHRPKNRIFTKGNRLFYCRNFSTFFFFFTGFGVCSDD